MKLFFRSLVIALCFFSFGFINHCLADCNDFDIYVVNKTNIELEGVIGARLPVYIKPLDATYLGRIKWSGSGTFNGDDLTITDITYDGGRYKDEKILFVHIDKSYCAKSSRDAGVTPGDFKHGPIDNFGTNHLGQLHTGDTQCAFRDFPLAKGCYYGERAGTVTLEIKQ